MKPFFKTCLAGSLLAVSQTSFAVGPYVGLSLGVMDVDGADSNPLNGGLVLGYDFSAEAFTFGLEAEFTTSLKDGEVVKNVDFELDSQALYLTGKLDINPQFYAKGRLGILREEIDSESDTGLSVGAGLGFRINNMISLEGEFTLIEEDVNFFSISARYRFY
ncbi:MAG: outer membrane beta-barrel protein [Gammaproteobacteria bacterium]